MQSNLTMELVEPMKVKIEWLSSINDKDGLDIIRLMNSVSVNETTMGFHEEFSNEEAAKLILNMKNEIGKGKCLLLIVRSIEDSIVGMLTISPQTLPARSHIVEIKRCVILPSYRGIFTLDCWEATLNKVKEIGASIIVIDVRSDGKAEKLWRMLGFIEYGRLEDYARVNEKIITGYFMSIYVQDAINYYAENGSWIHKQKSTRISSEKQ